MLNAPTTARLRETPIAREDMARHRLFRKRLNSQDPHGFPKPVSHREIGYSALDATRPQSSGPVGTGISLGVTGSAAGERGLATIRLDRLGDALAVGEPVRAGGTIAALGKPDFASFAFPTDTAVAG